MVAQTYDDHMLVCGLGNVGFRVVEHLIRYGEKVIAIEHNPDSRFVAEMQGFNVPVIIGDVRDVSLLERLNIKSAKALLVLFPMEEDLSWG